MLRVSSCKLATSLYACWNFQTGLFWHSQSIPSGGQPLPGLRQTLTLGEFDKVEKLSFAIVFCASVIMGAALDWFLASRFNCMRR